MRAIGFVVFLLFAFPSWSEEVYYCDVISLTGFTFDKDKKTWEQRSFDPKNLNWKILMRRDGDADVSGAIVKSHHTWIAYVGEKDNLIHMGCADSIDGENLICDGLFSGELKIGKKNLRMLYVQTWGYWSDKIGSANRYQMEGESQPMIGIGRCQRL